MSLLKPHRAIFSLIFLFSSLSHAQITVLEYKAKDDDLLHGKSVHWIACQTNMQSCTLQYVEEMNDPAFVETFLSQLTKTHVVNMSFAIQKPPPPSDRPTYARFVAVEREENTKYESVIAEYERDSKTLTDWIRKHPKVLFVAAAGNGIPLSGGFQAKGVALNEKTLLYPQILSEPNLVKVASINLSSFDIRQPQSYQLADYSNYGLDLVDVAAPVEANQEGLFQGGTSFAAPYVTRLVDDINKRSPTLTAPQVRQVLLRSCHIQDVKKAIWATEDLEQNGAESVVYQAMYHRKRMEREQLQQGPLSGVLLVACGGVISEDLALRCAELIEKRGANHTAGVDDACAFAHSELLGLNREQSSDLKTLWRLRHL
jgi:subtilisin family serine protease